MDLRKNTPFNATLYTLALAAVIVGELKGWRPLVYAAKPLLMVVLSSWFFFNSRRVGDRFTLLVQVGLFFSLVGDMALMFQHLDRFNFLVGLGAFIMVMICYTIAFGHNISEAGTGDGLLLPMVISIGLLAFGFFFVLDLLPHLDEAIMLPVVVHAGAAVLMGIGASFRFGRTFLTSFLPVMGGAVLFILANFLLAQHRMRPVDHAVWSVPLMYGVGQFLIAAGCLAHVLDPEEIRRKAALST